MFKISPKNRKLQLALNGDVPNLSEIHSSLGATLAQTFFEHDYAESEKHLAVPPVFSVCEQPHLCAKLDNNTEFKSVPKHELIKDELHSHILELGQNLLGQFQREIEQKVEKRIEDQFEEKLFLYAAKKRKEFELNTQDLHTKYEDFLKTVQRELEEKLQVVWSDLIAKHNKDLQKAVVRERMNVTHEMLRKMRNEISYIVSCLYRDFEETFCSQKQNIIADFNEIMRKKYVEFNERIKEVERTKEQDLYIQRHELEMQSSADIIYLLCSERLRNHMEKHEIHKYFEEKISILEETIVNLNKTLSVLKEDVTQRELNMRSEKNEISKIAKEFTKLVHVLFEAEPGHQAEFLLPPELLSLNHLKNNNKSDQLNDIENDQQK